MLREKMHAEIMRDLEERINRWDTWFPNEEILGSVPDQLLYQLLQYRFIDGGNE